MPKKNIRLKYKFLEKVKEFIRNDNSTNIGICNSLDINAYGLHRMLERDSQTLMHIHILVFVSEKLKTPIKNLYEQ